MAHTERDYKDTANALPDGYLGNRFGRFSLDKAAVSAIHARALFNDNAEQMGLLGGSVGESVQKRGLALAKTIAQAHAAKTRREKASTDDVIFLDLLARIDTLNERLADVRENIKTLDEELRAEYGDDYLEIMAQKYLDEDALSTLEGLSPEQREAQIKALLSDRMLNDDGTIKDAYKDTKIAKILEQMKKEADLQERVDRLIKAHESGDPEAARKVLEEDELADDAAHNVRKQNLKEKFGPSASGANAEALKAKEAELASALEAKDVEEEAAPEATIAAFDSFGNG